MDFFLRVRKGGREKHWCSREIIISCLLNIPQLGPNHTCICVLTRNHASVHGMMFQPTEPHYPGLIMEFLKITHGCLITRKRERGCSSACLWAQLWTHLRFCPKKPLVEVEVGCRGGTSTKKSWISPVSKEGVEIFLLVKEEEIDI